MDEFLKQLREADAKDRPPSLDLKLALRRRKVDLLERVPLALELRNKGGTRVEVGPLRLGDDSISIVLREAKEGGKEFRLRRIHGTWTASGLVPEAVEKEGLRSVRKETLEMIAIRPGDYLVRAELAGIEGLEAPVASKEVDLTVTAPEEGKALRVTIRTSEGDMAAELYPDAAYNSCHEFVLHALDGYFGHGMTFFRIIENFMLQTGDPSNTGSKGFGYYLPQEFNEVKHEPGVLSLGEVQVFGIICPSEGDTHCTGLAVEPTGESSGGGS